MGSDTENGTKLLINVYHVDERDGSCGRYFPEGSGSRTDLLFACPPGLSLSSPSFTATIHKEKMGASVAERMASPPFPKGTVGVGKGAPGWWLSLFCT